MRKRINAGMSRADYRAYALAQNLARVRKQVVAFEAWVVKAEASGRYLEDATKALAEARAELAKLEGV